jgi:hypothetical protein
MKTKKSQIQMMETIAILFIFFVIVFIAIIFFSRIWRSSISEEVSKYQELSSIEVAQLASSLPELQCSEDNIVKSNCVDRLKVIAVQVTDQPQNDLLDVNYYFDFFGYSQITIQQIFPDSTDTWTIYHKAPEQIKNKRTTYFPISIFDPVENANYFGLLTLEVYQ